MIVGFGNGGRNAAWTERSGMIDLGRAGSANPPSMSANGIVAGAYVVPDTTTIRAFTWTQANGFVDLGTLGGTSSSANGVNRNGMVVGYSNLVGDAVGHAFAWTEAIGMVDLETLGGVSSIASTVNDNGTVVGSSDTAAGTRHATAWNMSLKPAPTITWPTPSDIVYGTALGATQLNATADVPGTFTYSPPDGTVLPAGDAQKLSVIFTPEDPQAFSETTASMFINVSKATPAIAWPRPAAILFGTSLGVAQLNATANLSGTFFYSPPAGTILPICA